MAKESILERAIRRKGAVNRLLDTHDVMLEALRNPRAAGIGGYVLVDSIDDDEKRKRLETRIEDYLAMMRPPDPGAAASSAWQTEQLNICAQEWAAEANAQGLDEASDALIIKAIIVNDDRIKSLMRRCDIPWQRVVADLDKEINPAATPLEMMDTAARLEARAASVAEELIQATPVNPSTSRIYMNFNFVLFNNLLRQLSELVRDVRVPICMGQHGSPLDLLEVILADHYATESVPFTAERAALNSFARVYKLDMAGLIHRWKAEKGLRMEVVMKQAKIKAKKDRAILLVDHVEIIPKQRPARAADDASLVRERNEREREGADPTDAARLAEQAKDDAISRLKAQIASHEGAFVVGIYHMTADERQDQAKIAAQLGHPDIIKPLYARPLDDDETRDLLKEFYFPKWQAQGFAFAEDCLENLLKLRPGIIIDKERIALPGAAIQLAEAFIRTAREGQVPRTVRRACVVADKLLRCKEAKEPDNKPYLEPLQNGQKALKVLRDAISGTLKRNIFWGWWGPLPQPRKVVPPMTVEFVHLLAQLLCDDDESRFAFPAAKHAGGDGAAPPAATS